MSIRLLFLFFMIALALVDTVVPFPIFQTFLRALILPVAMYLMLQKANPTLPYTFKDLIAWLTLSIIFHSFIALLKMGF